MRSHRTSPAAHASVRAVLVLICATLAGGCAGDDGGTHIDRADDIGSGDGATAVDSGQIDADGGELDAGGDEDSASDLGGSDAPSGEDADRADTDPRPSCVPSEPQWDAVVAPVVAAACGQCHGERPSYGAPFSLVDYESLIAGVEGERIVDRIVERVSNGTMPPPGYPRPSHEQADTIVGWASCGEAHPDFAAGLEASAPVFFAPEDAPTGLDTLDVTADEFPVSVDMLDHYENIRFSDLVEEDRFIRRIEYLIDEDRVLHHITLRKRVAGGGAGGGLVYLYAWAPGAGHIEFPGGGIRLTPSDELVLQIHYNNGAGVEDAVDSSGVRLYLAPPDGDEYAMVDPGPGAFGFVAPPAQVSQVEQDCVVDQPYEILAGMPHMHEIGSRFWTEIERADGTIEPVIELSGWSFELQLFYEMPFALSAGDNVRVKCEYDNPTDRVVRGGAATDDEMCYNFMYVTPPPADEFCADDGTGIDAADELEYTPGECFTDPSTELPVVTGGYEVEAPTYGAGTLSDGIYRVTDSSMTTTPPTPLAADVSIAASGQLRVEGGRVQLDGAVFIQSPTGPAAGGVQQTISVEGAVDGALVDGPVEVVAECQEGRVGRFGLGVGDDGQPTVAIPFEGLPIDVRFWLVFEPM